MVGFEPTQCWSQSPMPYRLATPHCPQIAGSFVGWSKRVELLTSRATIWRSTNWAKTTTKLQPVCFHEFLRLPFLPKNWILRHSNAHNLSTRLNHRHVVVGAPRRIWTFDLRLRRALLYPAELWKPVEQVKGIGPSQPAWKASVLPLNYTCKRPIMIAHHKMKVKEKRKKI